MKPLLLKFAWIFAAVAYMGARIWWGCLHPVQSIPPDLATTHLELIGVAEAIALIIVPFYLLALLSEDDL